MKTCMNCGAMADNDDMFCGSCGSRLPQGNACPGCGADVNPGSRFCSRCGTPVVAQSAAPQAPVFQPPVQQAPVFQPPVFEPPAPQIEEDDDDLSNIIYLNDEYGNEIPFEFLDLIEFRGKEYVVLLPQEDDDGEVVILQVDDTGDPNTESYCSVENQYVLQSVFQIFKERFKDEFNFT